MKPTWQTSDGSVRLWLGDCLDLLPTFAPGSVDAVVTDPPYGIGFPYEGYEDTPESLQDLIESFVPSSRAIASRVIITPGNTNIFRYPPADWVGAWTWDTTTARGFWGWSQWQPILLYGNDVWPGTNSKGGALKSDRIHFSGGEAKIDSGAGGGHTCPKPLTFVVKLLARFTMEGEIVLDPFMGSGTTGVACIRTGRRFIGIEKEPKYFDIAVKRIEADLSRAPLFEPAPEIQTTFLDHLTQEPNP